MAKAGCYFPFKVDNPYFGRTADAPAKIPVPCGKCPYCLQRRANNWVFRCLIENEFASFSFFVTLTYENPPMSDNGFMTLRKRDFQLFIKRLRKHKDNVKSNIKYYACGEYGTNTHRPHFHTILFNASKQSIYDCWENHHEGSITNGLLHIGDVTSDSICYTAKYMNKKQVHWYYNNDDRIPEFQLFSKQLGIQYVNSEEVKKYHLADPTRLFATIGRFKIAIPRYYRDKLYGPGDKALQAQYAQEQASKQFDEQYADYTKFRSKGQTFEQYRYSRKVNALASFRKKINSSRKKI